MSPERESGGDPANGGWLGTKTVAARLGVVPRTLYGMIHRGELPAYGFGRVIRFRADDVATFIEASHIQPGSLEHLHPTASGPAGPAAPTDDAPAGEDPPLDLWDTEPSADDAPVGRPDD